MTESEMMEAVAKMMDTAVKVTKMQEEGLFIELNKFVLTDEYDEYVQLAKSILEVMEEDLAGGNEFETELLEVMRMAVEGSESAKELARVALAGIESEGLTNEDIRAQLETIEVLAAETAPFN